MAPRCNSTTNSRISGRVQVEISTTFHLESGCHMTTGAQSPLISKELALEMEIVFQISLLTATSLIGVISNTINIIVFWKQGIKDSITVGLFALSVSDFFVIFFPFLIAACYTADHLYPNLPINFRAVAGISASQLHHLFYCLSCSLTAFISIERCVCIIKPLQVRALFTRRRTTIIFLGLFCFFVFGFSPQFFASRIVWQTSPSRNFSKILTIWHHPIMPYIEAYHKSFMTIFIPTAAQVIVTCAAIVMVGGLHKASRFRQMATRVHNNQSSNSTNQQDLQVAGEDQTAQLENIVTKENELLKNRDTRLVKTVVILVIVLSAANVPYVGLAYAQIVVPDLNPGMRFHNTFQLLSSINFFLVSINASVNAFVYYCTGSKYQKTVNEIFCCNQ